MVVKSSFLSVTALSYFSVLNNVVQAQGALKGTGSTTRGWSCCKNSCSWSGKAPVNNPVLSCDNVDNILNNPARRDGCDSGGGSFACSDLSPWAVSNDLAYGYAGVNLAAANETSWCCSCYQLTFTSGPVNGKKMVVQIVNTGSDLGHDQFDLAIPGGGQGDLQGCSKQFGRSDIWGETYGGVAHREDCDSFPEPLQGGCYWRFDWYRNADNPTVNWEKVSCPETLSFVSNCRRNDDPLPGKNTPTPTTSSKALPVASGTVPQGGQCGGRRYSGPTVCVSGTVCTFVSEDSYYCLPDPASTRSTPTTTIHTPVPTIAEPWDQCGGRGFTGPTRCRDSICVRFDEWYSQCQPPSSSSAARPRTTSTPAQGNPSNTGGWPGWSFTRPPRTRPGNTQRPQPGTPTSTSRPAQPGVTQIAQLFEQCGGRTFQGTVRCAEGLSCIYVDEYYSQCQKPAKA
ncbi:uncharacterized protein EI97DRAFT_170383 [Westerdykella ornata]|uniref:cellulase n=1 Tax=Westerdykella ornata TaxID=318751 RepID=A0A6A6JSK8_WESOR|nr:uncharacterized protein EI97DRAFT_170383 [Westerdykella ornata]KAF2279245.1 hypothetical protein EI97DRAFT_170383 [Westerdykella ornata]